MTQTVQTGAGASGNDQTPPVVVPDPKTVSTAAGQPNETIPNTESDDELDASSLDTKTQAYIAKLRKEAATHRSKKQELASEFNATKEQLAQIKKALGLVENEKPEDKIRGLESAKGSLELRNAILSHAVANGVGADGLDYFTYLVERRAGELADGEELDEEAISLLAKEVKSKSGRTANSSVSTSGSATPPAPGGSDDVSLDQFCAMTMAQKSQLYGRNAALYQRLKDEALAKQRLI